MKQPTMMGGQQWWVVYWVRCWVFWGACHVWSWRPVTQSSGRSSQLQTINRGPFRHYYSTTPPAPHLLLMIHTNVSEPCPLSQGSWASIGLNEDQSPCIAQVKLQLRACGRQLALRSVGPSVTSTDSYILIERGITQKFIFRLAHRVVIDEYN